jgi:dTDP-4-dehydrorhamnose 3,5-epimerase
VAAAGHQERAVQIRAEKGPLPDLWIIHPEVFQDERGFFSEIYREDQFTELGIPSRFVQWNHSGSCKGILRGLHFQWDPPMGKLMRVTRGEAFLVAVDVRKGSPTLGKWYGRVVNGSQKTAIYAPAGFARGFCAMADDTEIQYLCTGVYSSKGEGGIRWDDPVIGVDWPVKEPILSGRDKAAQSFNDWLVKKESDLFHYP